MYIYVLIFFIIITTIIETFKCKKGYKYCDKICKRTRYCNGSRDRKCTRPRYCNGTKNKTCTRTRYCNGTRDKKCTRPRYCTGTRRNCDGKNCNSQRYNIYKNTCTKSNYCITFEKF